MRPEDKPFDMNRDGKLDNLEKSMRDTYHMQNIDRMMNQKPTVNTSSYKRSGERWGLGKLIAVILIICFIGGFLAEFVGELIATIVVIIVAICLYNT